jgi:hypothetical protein
MSSDGQGVLASFEHALNDVLPHLQPRDMAMVELARTVALHIDCGDDLPKLIPQLAAILDALLMTPKARATTTTKTGGGTDGTPVSALDELRARRSRRHGTTPMDAATP